MSCLHLLEIKPWLVALFANLFLPIHRLTFHLVFSFLCCACVSKFHQVSFVSAFISSALGDWPRSHCYSLCQSALPRFPSRSFMVACLVFKSLKHFGFYSCTWCEGVFSLHRFTCGSPALPTPLAEETVLFSHCTRLPLLSKINCKCVGLFLGSLFCSIDPYVCFYANNMLFWLL